jgi:hypothetical protein
MKFELKIDPWNTRDSVLLADLQRVASELGKDTVTAHEYKEHGQYRAEAVRRRFGSWSRVIDAAGLQQPKPPRLADLDYFETLAEVWEALGRRPVYEDMRKPPSRHAPGLFAKRFGSWLKALEKFEAYLRGEVSSEERIERALLNLQHGPRPLAVRTPREADARLRFLVLRRDEFKCQRCGKSPVTDSEVSLEVEQLVAFPNGGDAVLENLRTVCRSCNGRTDALEPPSMKELGGRVENSRSDNKQDS